MNDSQKSLADSIVTHFQLHNGVHLTAKEIATKVSATEKDVKYVASLLTIKEILYKTDPLIMSATHLIEEKYFLTAKGWNFVSYDNLLKDEREKEAFQKKKEDLEINHIQSSVDSNNSVIKTNENVRSTNKWIKIWTAVNALAAAAIVVTALLKPDTIQQSELQQMKESMQFQQQSLRNIQTSLEKINSSIEKLKIDTPVSVRLKK